MISGKKVISLISCHNVLFRGRYPTLVLSPHRSKVYRTVFKTGLHIRHFEKKKSKNSKLNNCSENLKDNSSASEISFAINP